MFQYRRIPKALYTACGALVAAAVLAPAMAGAQGTAKTVTIVLSEEPASLDGCNSTRSDNGRLLQNNTVEGLTQIDLKTGAILPRLATSWEQTGELTWRFKLRSGVAFHDGAALDGDAVARSINRTMTAALACHTRGEYFGSLAVSAKAIDAATVELTTDVPSPILPAYMSWVMIVSPNTPLDRFAQTAIGTGPYIFDSFKPGQEITTKRNDKWWGPKPQVEAARYVWRTESSVRAAMVKIGEADLAPDIAAQDAKEPTLDVSYNNGETSYLRIDITQPPLDDRRLRLALNLAVDRNALRGSIFPKDVVPATNLVLPFVQGYNPNLKLWPYDPAQAKKLIAEAKAAGTPVDKEIRIFGRTNIYPNSQEAIEALHTMWTAVGFNMKIQMMEVGQWGKFSSKPFPEDRGPNVLQNRHNNQSGDAVFTATARWGCKGSGSVHCDPVIDGLIAEASQATGEKRVSRWQELFRYLYEDKVADVLLFHLVAYARVGPRINYAPTILTNNVIEVSNITFK